MMMLALKPIITESFEIVSAALGLIPAKVWWALLALVLIFTYGHFKYNAGYSSGYENAQIEARVELAKQHELAEKARKELEDKYIQQAVKFIVTRDAEYAKRDKVISDWQSGRLRLKARFDKQTCPTSGNNAGTESGLLGEDVQFLIRESTRADAIVHQLNACQGLIKDGL